MRQLHKIVQMSNICSPEIYPKSLADSRKFILDQRVFHSDN